MSHDRDTFVIIDGHAVIYRAFFAFPELTDPQGRLINAVYGFTKIVLTVLQDFSPEYVAVAFDHPQPTFRHADFAEYKAHREEMPDELKPQVDSIKEIVSALNIPRFEIAGYEADDIVGTLARTASQAAEGPVDVIIVTGDKDMLQLVDNHIKVFMPGRGKFSKDTLYNEEKVKEKMKVAPAQVPDLKALMGDSSDNIPGVRGIGPKIASELIAEYTSLAGVYQNLEKITSARVKNLLETGQELAELSLQLATINTEVPLDFSLEACRLREYDKEVVVQLFEELAFHSLKKLLPLDVFEQDIQDSLF